MMNLRALAMLVLAPFAAQAVTVAIVDSGVDYKHEKLEDKMWKNPIEFPLGFNNRDDDKNGYQDDIYGWNFFGQDSKVIDYKYLGTFSNDPKTFYEIQLKSLNGKATPEEKKWVKEKLEDEEFIKEIGKFSNFIHGTHVSGITSGVEKSAEIMAIRMIPVEVELPSLPGVSLFSTDSPFLANMLASERPPLAGLNRDLISFFIKKALDVLAKEQMKLLTEISEYVDSHKVDIVNGSFGTGGAQAAMIVGTLHKVLSGKDASPETLAELTVYFLKGLITEGKKVVAAAPNTLFVYASGNDGMDNDLVPSSPASIEADNVIAVGASNGRTSVAAFSNYGRKSVHVLAPGVGIYSSIPGDEYIAASGTSQAAPYVAGLAAAMKKINGDLKPAEIKQILMETVDKRQTFAAASASGGIVNDKRAKLAALLAKRTSVSKAIATAKGSVKDITPKALGIRRISADAAKLVMPLPSVFKLR